MCDRTSSFDGKDCPRSQNIASGQPSLLDNNNSQHGASEVSVTVNMDEPISRYQAATEHSATAGDFGSDIDLCFTQGHVQSQGVSVEDRFASEDCEILGSYARKGNNSSEISHASLSTPVDELHGMSNESQPAVFKASQAESSGVQGFNAVALQSIMKGPQSEVSDKDMENVEMVIGDGINDPNPVGVGNETLEDASADLDCDCGYPDEEISSQNSRNASGENDLLGTSVHTADAQLEMLVDDEPEANSSFVQCSGAQENSNSLDHASCQEAEEYADTAQDTNQHHGSDSIPLSQGKRPNFASVGEQEDCASETAVEFCDSPQDVLVEENTSTAISQACPSSLCSLDHVHGLFASDSLELDDGALFSSQQLKFASENNDGGVPECTPSHMQICEQLCTQENERCASMGEETKCNTLETNVETRYGDTHTSDDGRSQTCMSDEQQEVYSSQMCRDDSDRNGEGVPECTQSHSQVCEQRCSQESERFASMDEKTNCSTLETNIQALHEDSHTSDDEQSQKFVPGEQQEVYSAQICRDNSECNSEGVPECTQSHSQVCEQRCTQDSERFPSMDEEIICKALDEDSHTVDDEQSQKIVFDEQQDMFSAQMGRNNAECLPFDSAVAPEEEKALPKSVPNTQLPTTPAEMSLTNHDATDQDEQSGTLSTASNDEEKRRAATPVQHTHCNTDEAEPMAVDEPMDVQEAVVDGQNEGHLCSGCFSAATAAVVISAVAGVVVDVVVVVERMETLHGAPSPGWFL